MQTFYRCEDGFEARAEQVTTKACKKLVTDIHHETRIQAIINLLRVETWREGQQRRSKKDDIDPGQYLEVDKEH